MDPKPISLAESIAALRSQLEAAAYRQQQSVRSGDHRLVPPLLVKEITLETEVIAVRDAGGEAKLNYWIAEAGLNTRKEHSIAQKVTIRLEVQQMVDPATGETISLTLGGPDSGQDPGVDHT